MPSTAPPTRSRWSSRDARPGPARHGRGGHRDGGARAGPRRDPGQHGPGGQHRAVRRRQHHRRRRLLRRAGDGRRRRPELPRRQGRQLHRRRDALPEEVPTGHRHPGAGPLLRGLPGRLPGERSGDHRQGRRLCGINPRVLLVLLQKEQSIVTTKTPTVYAYDHATGFACPDTAPCNPAFTGFVSQVSSAARQFERYRIDAKSFRYKAGRINTIQWHPDRACGTSDVFIANQATAGLYNYTPYRPSQAALNAGYAAVLKSDPASACAAYRNRTFWNYFTDWFGSTQSPGGTAILDLYTANGGPSSPLGQATSGIACGLVGGGCFQHYGSASIYWSPATGAHVTSDSIRWRWGALGWEKSVLGYPTTDTSCGLVKGGCFQFFQGGSLYAMGKTIGPFVVRGAI